MINTPSIGGLRWVIIMIIKCEHEHVRFYHRIWYNNYLHSVEDIKHSRIATPESELTTGPYSARQIAEYITWQARSWAKIDINVEMDLSNKSHWRSTIVRWIILEQLRRKQSPNCFSRSCYRHSSGEWSSLLIAVAISLYVSRRFVNQVRGTMCCNCWRVDDYHRYRLDGVLRWAAWWSIGCDAM